MVICRLQRRPVRVVVSGARVTLDITVDEYDNCTSKHALLTHPHNVPDGQIDTVSHIHHCQIDLSLFFVSYTNYVHVDCLSVLLYICLNYISS